MVNDRKLFIILLVLLALPVGLAFFGNDRFRYPCQDPANWDKDMCKFPQCDVTRTCPEHVFKGQRDPRLGPPPTRVEPMGQTTAPVNQCPAPTQGANCGK
jgi:hypothetical protein